jgi:hypothetical protein
MHVRSLLSKLTFPRKGPASRHDVEVRCQHQGLANSLQKHGAKLLKVIYTETV